MIIIGIMNPSPSNVGTTSTVAKTPVVEKTATELASDKVIATLRSRPMQTLRLKPMLMLK